jgi:TnpA family transposase
MSFIKVLSYSQKKEFESPPLLSDEARRELFTIPVSMELQLASIDKDMNQLYFIMMHGYFKLTRTFYEHSVFHNNDIDYISRLYGLRADTIEVAIRTQTRYKRIIREHFGFLSRDDNLRKILEAEASHLITKLSNLKALFYALVEISVANRYEVPSYTFLVQIITKAMNSHKWHIFDQLKSLSQHQALRALDLFLEDDEVYASRYSLSRFKKLSHSLKPAKIKDTVNTFTTVQNIHAGLLEIVEIIELDLNVAKHYALWVEKSDMHQILRKAKYKQQFDLICFVTHQTYMRTDQLCDILVQSVQSAKTSALREHQNSYFLQRQSRSKSSGEMASLLKNSLIPKVYSIKKTLSSDIDADQKLQIIQKEIDAMIADEQEKKAFLEEHNELSDHTSYHTILEERSRKLQNRVSEIIKALEFDEKESDKSLLNAIAFFKTTGGSITVKIPMEFLSEEEKESLNSNNTEDAFRISLYKMFFFIAISDAIKSGTLNLKHSYRYRAFNNYLIDSTEYTNTKEAQLERHKLMAIKDFDAVSEELQGSLSSIYRGTNTNITKGINEYFHLKVDGSFIVTTPKVEKNDAIEGLHNYLPKEKFIPLIEVLRLIDRHAQFSAKFHHHSHSKSYRAPKYNALYASIIGYGCNISIAKMAKISKGITMSDIDHIRTWYLSNDMLQEANDTVIELTETLGIPKLLRNNQERNHTASDGQKFNTSVESLNSGYSFKYFGLGRGVSRYTFSDESGRLFYTTVINANEREAAYVIDGLMYQEVIQSDIHSTDTFGYSEVVFALTHLLGLVFAPRIKNFKEQQLYAFEPRKLYKDYGYILLPVKQINTAIIEDQWDQILRMVITIKERRTTVTQLLKRLTSYSRKHKLYQALREFGRIIKTRFLLNYIDDVAFRQQIEKQLNKVESANKFSKAVFFGNSGEYFYATKEEQDIASNALRLIQNSIICWNYLYVSNLLTKEKDEETRDKVIKTLRNGSIVHWQHINFYGEYDFTERQNEGDEFDVEAIKCFSIEKYLQKEEKSL